MFLFSFESSNEADIFSCFLTEIRAWRLPVLGILCARESAKIEWKSWGKKSKRGKGEGISIRKLANFTAKHSKTRKLKISSRRGDARDSGQDTFTGTLYGGMGGTSKNDDTKRPLIIGKIEGRFEMKRVIKWSNKLSLDLNLRAYRNRLAGFALLASDTLVKKEIKEERKSLKPQWHSGTFCGEKELRK